MVQHQHDQGVRLFIIILYAVLYRIKLFAQFNYIVVNFIPEAAGFILLWIVYYSGSENNHSK